MIYFKKWILCCRASVPYYIIDDVKMKYLFFYMIKKQNIVNGDVI